MAIFRVWAPNAQTVELELAGRRLPMISTANGWWTSEADARAGSRYRYALDGGPPFPDPRSPFQPEGVHGPSELIDHAAFQWNDQHFQSVPLPSAVIYELHTGTFTPEGTFDAAIEKLESLARLGVTHIELMPVAEFPGKHGWGYDGVALYAPHHPYGGPNGLKRLVDACHQRGLGVILDVVYNHFGPDGAYHSNFGPYLTSRHKTPWGDAVNLDGPGSDEVRRYLIENALMWLRDYHFDALRLDAVHALIDDSAYHFLEELGVEIHRLGIVLGRHLYVIAESDQNNPRLVRPTQMGGYGLDAQWSDDFHHALHNLLTRENSGYYVDFKGYESLAKALENGWVYAGDYSYFRGRRHGWRPDSLPGFHLLGYLQNHDQVGNRATGERISHLVGERLARIGAALVLTAPFVPMLFQGEEWAASTPFQYFTDHQDEELGRLVSEGRRNEFDSFGWSPEDVPDPQDEQTFRRSKLNWDELGREPHAAMLEWVRKLIALRRKTPDLIDGDLHAVRVQYNAEAGWLAVRRKSIILVANLAEREQPVHLDLPYRNILLASEPGAQLIDNGLVAPPCSAVILSTAT